MYHQETLEKTKFFLKKKQLFSYEWHFGNINWCKSCHIPYKFWITSARPNRKQQCAKKVYSALQNERRFIFVQKILWFYLECDRGISAFPNIQIRDGKRNRPLQFYSTKKTKTKKKWFMCSILRLKTFLNVS